MHTIKTEDFLDFVKRSNKKTYMTPFRNKEFSVEVASYGILYTPHSTSKTRKQSMNYIEKIIEEFNQTGSFNPTDYKHITANSSYTLTLISEYAKSLRS
jgi:hypothetical protein